MSSAFPPPDSVAPAAPPRTHRSLLLVLAGGLGLCVVMCGGAGWWLSRVMFAVPPRPVDASFEVTAPLEVEPRQAFQIEIRITNEAGTPQVLDSIDFDDLYLDGVQLRGSSPPWSNATRFYADIVTHDFQIEIPSHGVQSVVFDAVALGVGDYRGNIDVCINEPNECLTQIVRTIIARPEP